jgi:hypothetical protein
MTIKFLLILSSFLLLVGCGDGRNVISKSDNATVSKKEAAKQVLKGYADSGNIGSGEMIIRDTMEGLKTENVPNMDEIMKLTNEMVAAKSPAMVTEKANEIIKKLE